MPDRPLSDAELAELARLSNPSVDWTVVSHAAVEALPRLLADLAEARRERDRRAEFMERAGYRRCDIPACNCGSWHGGHADARLSELRDEIGENGKTLLQSARDLRATIAARDRRIEELEANGQELWNAAKNAPLGPEHTERYVRALCKFQPDWQRAAARAALAAEKGTPE